MPRGSVPAFVIDGTLAERLAQAEAEAQKQAAPEHIPDFDPARMAD